METITKVICVPLMCVLRFIGLVLYALFFLLTYGIECAIGYGIKAVDLILGADSLSKGERSDPLGRERDGGTDEIQD